MRLFSASHTSSQVTLSLRDEAPRLLRRRSGPRDVLGRTDSHVHACREQGQWISVRPRETGGRDQLVDRPYVLDPVERPRFVFGRRGTKTATLPAVQPEACRQEVLQLGDVVSRHGRADAHVDRAARPAVRPSTHAPVARPVVSVPADAHHRPHVRESVPRARREHGGQPRRVQREEPDAGAAVRPADVGSARSSPGRTRPRARPARALPAPSWRRAPDRPRRRRRTSRPRVRAAAVAARRPAGIASAET